MKKKMIIIGAVNGFLMLLIMGILTAFLVNKPNPQLKTNDQLVPITVMGAVNKPQTFNCRKGQLFRDVVSCFGGFTGEADINEDLLNKQLVIREVINVKKAKPFNINKATIEDLQKLGLTQDKCHEIISLNANKSNQFHTHLELVERGCFSKQDIARYKNRITFK